MEEKLLKIKEDLKQALNKASKEADVLDIKSEYVGKKSEIQNILESMEV